MPPGEPPDFIPSKTDAIYLSNGCCGPATFHLGTGMIYSSTNQFVYVWCRNNDEYWSWLNNVSDKGYISGLRWDGSDWTAFRESFLNIQGYYCYNPFR
jgi:hypothetical protein